MTKEAEPQTDRRPVQRALVACAKWSQFCLRIGWSKSQLDALEALWWKYHDDQGRLINHVRQTTN